MKRTIFQHPTILDDKGNVIQQGTYSKESPLVNATNDGVLDYINNNLEALYDNINGARIYVANKDALPDVGDVANVYIAQDTGKWYYWDPSTSAYVEIDNTRNVANDAIAARDMANAWAQSTSSPDGAADTASSTGKTQSSKTWALYSKDRATAAQKYAQQAEASAKAIKEKEILAITDSVQLAVNTEDGGLDIIVTTDE